MIRLDASNQLLLGLDNHGTERAEKQRNAAASRRPDYGNGRVALRAAMLYLGAVRCGSVENIDIRDPDELWKKMKEQQAAGNLDNYYLLAQRAETMIDTYVKHYGLCCELGAAHGIRARDTNTCRPGRKVAAIRSYLYYDKAALLAANSATEVRVVPVGWQSQGNGCLDRRSAQTRALQEAASVLLQLDWVSDSWKWLWVSRGLDQVVELMTTYDPAHLQLGEAYFRLDDLDKAESTWRHAQGLPNATAELGDRLRALRFRRAEKAAQAGHWTETVRMLDGQCDLTLKEMVLLGDAFRQLGETERARGSWEYVLRRQPDDASVQERLHDLKAA